MAVVVEALESASVTQDFQAPTAAFQCSWDAHQTANCAAKTASVTIASKDATCLILAPDMADVEEAPGSARVTRDGLAKPVTLRNVQLGLKEFRRKSRAIQFVETA